MGMIPKRFLPPIKDTLAVFLSGAGVDISLGDTETIEAPYDFTLDYAWIAITDAPDVGSVIVDIKKNGVSIVSTKAEIQSGEFSSLTGVAPVFTDVNFVKGDRITHNIFQTGSVEAGRSLRAYLEVTKV